MFRNCLLGIALALALTMGAQAQWKSVAPGSVAAHFFTDVVFTTPTTGFVTGWAGGRKAAILKTTDAGDTWTMQPFDGMQLHAVGFFNETNGLATGYDYDCKCGVTSRSVDGGGTWTSATHAGIGTIYSLAILDDQTAIAAGSSGGLLKTTDRGGSWRTIPTPEIAFAAITFPSPTVGYALGYGSGNRATVLYKTTNGGDAWERLDDYTGSRVLGDLYFVNPDVGYMVGMEQGMTIYKTTDGGKNWVRQHNGAGAGDALLQTVVFIDENQGYALGDNGAVFRTRNGGAQWKPEASGTSSSIKGAAFIDGQVGIAAGDLGLLRKRTDPYAGLSPSASFDADELDFGAVKIGERRQAMFSVRSGNGAVVTIDSIYIDGSPAAVAQFSVTSPNQSALPADIEGEEFIEINVEFAPTISGPVSAEVVITTNDPTLPTKRVLMNANGVAGVHARRGKNAFALEIRPNPAGPTATVHLSGIAPGRTTVALYDLLGRRVMTIHDGTMESGSASIALDTGSLPPGIYHCRVDSPGASAGEMITITR